jgi:hypothetical protein
MGNSYSFTRNEIVEGCLNRFSTIIVFSELPGGKQITLGSFNPQPAAQSVADPRKNLFGYLL